MKELINIWTIGLTPSEFWAFIAGLFATGLIFLYGSYKMIDVILGWWDRRKLRKRLMNSINSSSFKY